MAEGFQKGLRIFKRPRFIFHVLKRSIELILKGAVKQVPRRVDFIEQDGLLFRGRFSRSGRCGCTKIRCKICNSRIGLMANARNDRNMAIDDRLGDNFLIKAPQVFE